MLLDANGKILIVGGYGAVGQVITASLIQRLPNIVIVAGRNFNKASEFASSFNGRVQPLAFDLAVAHEHPEILDDVAIVIMCLDVPDTKFIKLCFERGIHYIDITAEDTILQHIEALEHTAQSGKSTAILSVGLAPGVTNLLTGLAYKEFDAIHHVDIHILLGLGEAHGKAAVLWILDNLNTSYSVYENGTLRKIRSFGEHQLVRFSGEARERKVFRFNISDQHVVTRTLQLPSASSWVAFDPSWLSTLLYFLRWSGFTRLFQYSWFKQMVARLSQMIHLGSNNFIVQVEAKGEIDGKKKERVYSFSGRGQSHATGFVTAHVVEKLIHTKGQYGVFHIEQIIEPSSFLKELTELGIGSYESKNTEVH